MNIKTISIALAAVAVLLLATLLMQKGGYVSQATEHYQKTSEKSFKSASQVVQYVNNSIEVNKSVWVLATEIVQNVKTSQDQARLEAKLFPSTKRNMSIANKTRKFEASSDYYIVTNFAKVEEDKKTGVKSLAGLTSVNVNALLGNAVVADEEEGDDEDAVEEEEEVKPVKKAPAKAKKGKKGKNRR